MALRIIYYNYYYVSVVPHCRLNYLQVSIYILMPLDCVSLHLAIPLILDLVLPQLQLEHFLASKCQLIGSGY